MKQTLKATINNTEYQWSVEIAGSDLVIEAARKGFQEWLGDASSTAQPTDEEAKDPRSILDTKTKDYKEFMAPIRERAVRERLQKIIDGTYKPGRGGGGGGSLSAEDHGWIAYFKAEGIQQGGKPVNGKTLRRAQEELCRKDLIAEFDPGTPERKDREANIGKHLEAQFDSWRNMVENDLEDPIGQYIDLERKKTQIPTTGRKRQFRGKTA